MGLKKTWLLPTNLLHPQQTLKIKTVQYSKYYLTIMKKLITITLAILFTGAISSCQKERVAPETAALHSFGSSARRDLGTAD